MTHALCQPLPVAFVPALLIQMYPPKLSLYTPFLNLIAPSDIGILLPVCNTFSCVLLLLIHTFVAHLFHFVVHIVLYVLYNTL